jgi:hypothetical protein
MIKGIHLALEVKTSFDNPRTTMGSSTESSNEKSELPLAAIIGITEKKRRTYT